MTAKDDEDKLLRSVALQNAESIRMARQRAEHQVEATLQEQANLLNLTHDSIFVQDLGGVIKYWNRAAEELYGWPAQEAVGSIAHDLLKTAFPAPLGQIEAELLAAGRWEGELLHTKRDGTQVVVESRWSLQRDEQGGPVAILETNNDVSERKRAEEARERLRRLEADLARVNRISTMGELTASLAHEVNQPIAAAITDANTCLRWLLRDEPDLHEAREAAKRAVKDASRAAEIIGRMRALFKKSSPEHEPVDLNEVITEIVALVRSEALRDGVSMATELTADLPVLMGDRIQLQQVVLNLVVNGLEATRNVAGRREITVTSRRDGRDHLLVSVTDTGVGLPPNADEIFNAFFTTKPEGTGVGLAISRSIIESHDGRLWATANAGGGATFCFRLPATGGAGKTSRLI